MPKELQNSQNLPSTVSTQWHALLQKTLDLARKKGATDTMVSLNRDQGFSVDVRMGEVETISFNEDKGISVVVYIGHQKGTASSTDTSDQALDTMVQAACDIARVSAEDRCFGLADSALMTNDYPELSLYHPWSIAPPEAIEKALACEKYALSLDKRITNSDGVNISTFNFTHAYATSYGFEGAFNGSRHSLSCALIAQEGESMQRDYEYSTSRDPGLLSSIEQVASLAVKHTVGRLNAGKVKTAKVPVLFSPRVSSGLFSSFIQAIGGSNLYRKNSFLVGSLGKQVFPQGIKVYEQPHLLKALGSCPFDGEGVLTRNNVFVEDGRVAQYVLGSYSARRMGLQTTANSGGVHNLTIDATVDLDMDDLIKKMGTGLLITELMGQGVNGLTGDYSRGASGFWVEDGQIQFPVEGVTVASNLTDMYQRIVAIGKDVNPNTSTQCGSILIEEMMMAGH